MVRRRGLTVSTPAAVPWHVPVTQLSIAGECALLLRQFWAALKSHNEYGKLNDMVEAQRKTPKTEDEAFEMNANVVIGLLERIHERTHDKTGFNHLFNMFQHGLHELHIAVPLDFLDGLLREAVRHEWLAISPYIGGILKRDERSVFRRINQRHHRGLLSDRAVGEATNDLLPDRPHLVARFLDIIRYEDTARRLLERAREFGGMKCPSHLLRRRPLCMAEDKEFTMLEWGCF